MSELPAIGIFDDEEPEVRSRSILDVLNSKAVVALITVTIGGAFTTVIATLLQRGDRERAVQTAWVHERAQHRMQAQRAFLDEQRLASEQAFKLVGKMIRGGEAITSANSDLFDDRHFKGEQLKKARDLKEKMRNQYNDAGEEWEQAHTVLGYLLADYPAGNEAVFLAWSQIEKSVDEYGVCVVGQATIRQSKEYAQRKVELPSCSEHHKHLIQAADNLRIVLRRSRSSARWDWEQATVLEALVEAETSSKTAKAQLGQWFQP